MFGFVTNFDKQRHTLFKILKVNIDHLFYSRNSTIYCIYVMNNMQHSHSRNNPKHLKYLVCLPLIIFPVTNPWEWLISVQGR